MRSRAALAYLCVGALASIAYLTMPSLPGDGVLFDVIGLSAAAAIVVGALWHRPRPLLPWMLFAVAQVSFALGDLFYYALDAELPSVGDVFYLAVYPLLIAGLLLLVRARTSGRDRASLVDASIITVGIGLLAWVFLIQPNTQLDGSALGRAVSLAYPLMDVMLLAVAARLAVGVGARPASFYLICTGIVCLLATDAAYSYIVLHGEYEQGSLLDAGWLAYYLLWGTAALLPGMARLGEPTAVVRTILSERRLVALTAASLIAPIVGIVEARKGDATACLVSAVASALLFLLVVLRMTDLVRTLSRAVADEQRAVSREGVLRRAAVALAGAPDQAAIESATAEAARALAGDGEVFVDVDVQVDIGPARPTAGDPGPGEAVGRQASLAAIEVPIATHASSHGAVRVLGPAAVPPAVRSALETLGAQAAVALDRAVLADDLLRRRSDERIAALVEQASDVITVLDADLVVQYHTASARLFLGYEPGGLVGRMALELVHPEDVEVAGAFFGSLVGEPGARPACELRFRTAGMSWAPVEVVGNNLLHDPLVDGIVLTIRDASTRKALEEGLTRQVEELKELDQIKTDLVCTVSHELRTPLTTLMGRVEMLVDGELGELTTDQQEAVRAIERNSQRLLRLIEDLLTLAKIEKGAFDLDLAPTDVHELVGELESAIVPVAESRSIDISIALETGLDTVVADRSQLERALLNLLSNAVKFTPPGGKVALRVTSDRDDVIFSVADTGIGMTEDDLERVFTRFFRSAAATRMAIQGTGLGLAIVKKIVDDHHGTITVDSAPEVGTTFTFTIPRAPASRPAHVPAGSPG